MLQKVKNLYHLATAVAANLAYGFPGRKMIMIGVTGTDGKTTTTSLIYWILLKSGRKAAKMTTVGSEINGRLVSYSLHTTTPDPLELQRFLAECRKQGCSHVVLEVSSHGIDQNRIWGVAFEVGVLTNLAQNEHLDYHGRFENYKKAKLSFLAKCNNQVVEANGLTRSAFSFKTKLLGKFNEENCLSAVAACRILGVSEEDIKKGLESFTAPPGRLEMVVSHPYKVIVDFAHTGQAFERVLPVVRELTSQEGRLIHVFGATGDRDRSKRPIMTKVAAKYDDVVFLTHEDTYSEDIGQILSELEVGFKQASYKKYQKVSSRKEAIHKALKLAKPGDVVLISGVGHQQTMNLGGNDIRWSDQEVVRAFLKS